MDQIKKWSDIAQEEWFTKLPKEEQAVVARQYSSVREKVQPSSGELYSNREAKVEEYQNLERKFKSRILASKGRAPNKDEWEVFNNRYGYDWTIKQEPGLTDVPFSHEDLIGLGAAKWFAKQFSRKGAVKAPSIAGKQGGWIGTKELKQSVPIKVAGKELHLDLEFVDDLAKSGGKYIKPSMFSDKATSLMLTPSVFKQLPKDTQLKLIRDTTLPKTTPGYHKGSQDLVGLNKDEWAAAKGYPVDKPRYSIAHEVEHNIAKHQGLPGGSSPDAVREQLLKNKALKEMSDTNLDKFDSVVYDAYRHSAGEVLANTNQAFHNIAIDELARGKSPAEVKELLTKAAKTPDNIIARHYAKLGTKYDPEKVWSSKTQLYKVMSDESPKQLAKRATEDSKGMLEKLPALLSEQNPELLPGSTMLDNIDIDLGKIPWFLNEQNL